MATSPTTVTSTTMQANQANQANQAIAQQPSVEAFRRAVQFVLTEWPSLNFALENGMGGQESKQKQAWMCDHIAEVMLRGKDIDLEDYLAQMINQEFDTLIEDGSLEYNVKWIEKFYRDCQQGKEQEVLNSIQQAAVKKQSLGSMRIPPPVNATQESSDDDDDDDQDQDQDQDEEHDEH